MKWDVKPPVEGPVDEPLSAPPDWDDPPDNEHARRAVSFIQGCPHTKGDLAKQGKTLGDSWLPWEDRATRHIFGKVDEDGYRVVRHALLELPKKSGKAEHVSNEIPTPDGLKTMGEIRPGDYVFGSDGSPVKVVAATPVQFGEPCYEVEFATGESITVSGEHLWKVRQRKTVKNRNRRWTEEEEDLLAETYTTGGANAACAALPHRSRYAIQKRASQNGLSTEGRHHRSAHKLAEPHQRSMPAVRDVLSTEEMSSDIEYDAGSSMAYRYAVGVPPALELPEQELPVPPYTLGAWLGDGTASNAGITTQDPEIIDRIREEGVPVREWSSSSTARRYGLTNGDRTARGRERSIKSRLRREGLLENKHIPVRYLRSSYDQRLELLRGLMDTDGTISKKKGQCSFSNTNERLARDVQELVCTLGMKATWNSRPAKLNGETFGTSYRVRFYPPSGLRVFHVPRKAERQVDRDDGSRSDYRSIVDIRRVDSVPVKCITVDAEDGVYLTGRSMIPTHNSHWLAAAMLYLLGPATKPGAELFSAAYDHGQAMVVWKIAEKMCEYAGWTGDKVSVRSYQGCWELENPKADALYKPLTRKAASKHGINPYAVAFDELHEQPDRSLWDTLDESMGAWREPLMCAITNSGHDRTSLCYQQREYAIQNNHDPFDESFLGVIYGLEEGFEGVGEPEDWKRANPGVPVTVDVETVGRMARTASRQPAKLNAFQRWQLGIWTRSVTRWIDPDVWEKAGREIDWSEFRGRPCYGGLDLGSVSDLTAWVLAFPDPDDPDTVDLKCLAWCPEYALDDAENPHRDHYMVWVRQGWLKTTPGRVTDYRAVQRQIRADAKSFGLVDMAVDAAFQGNQLIVELMDEGFNVMSMRTTYTDMTDPTNEFERRLLMDPPRIRHDGNPVLAWAVQNVALRQPDPDRRRPVKDTEEAKIDPVVASLMALSRAMRHETGESRESAYNDPEKEMLVL